MKIYTRLISIGLALIVFLGALSACGKQGAVSPTPPAETPTESVELTPAPSITQTPEPVQTPTPEPELSPEAPYDVLNDPNVIWGENRAYIDWFIDQSTPAGYIDIDPLLVETLDSSTDDTLIAFALEPKGSYFATLHGKLFPVNLAPIDANRLVIHQDLDPDGALLALINEINEYQNINNVIDYMDKFSSEYIVPIHDEIYREIIPIAETYTTSGEDYETAKKRAFVDLLATDEYFVDLHNRYDYYLDIKNDFWYSWATQQYEYIRMWMVERGFIPVFSLEQADEAANVKEAVCCNYIEGERFEPFLHFQEVAKVFVGTKQQICELFQYVKESDGGCRFKSAGKTMNIPLQ